MKEGVNVCPCCLQQFGRHALHGGFVAESRKAREVMEGALRRIWYHHFRPHTNTVMLRPP